MLDEEYSGWIVFDMLLKTDSCRSLTNSAYDTASSKPCRCLFTDVDMLEKNLKLQGSINMGKNHLKIMLYATHDTKGKKKLLFS